MIQREWTLQRACVAFLGKALPHDSYWTAIDIGSAGSAQQGMLRKARGVRPGIADLLIVHNGVTVWCELKAGSSLSEAQKLFRDSVTANGHRWALARSPDDVEAALLAAGIPLRATLGEIRERIEQQHEHLPKRKRPPQRAPRPLNSLSIAAYRRLNAKGLL